MPSSSPSTTLLILIYVVLTSLSSCTTITGVGTTLNFHAMDSVTSSFNLFSSSNNSVILIQDFQNTAWTEQFENGGIDFGFTESVNEVLMCTTCSDVRLASVMGSAFAVIFNLPNFITNTTIIPPTELLLSQKVFTSILSGNISKWNDPQILALANSTSAFNTLNVSQDIKVIANKDPLVRPVLDSILTKFDAPSINSWKVFQNTTDGLNTISAVSQHPYSISIVSYEVALSQHWNSFASLLNKDQNRIVLNSASVQAAVESAVTVSTTTPTDISDASGSAWPLTVFTYLVYHTSFSDCDKANNIIDLINFVVSNTDAISRTVSFGHGPLTQQMQDTSLSGLKEVSCNGKLVLGTPTTVFGMGSTLIGRLFAEWMYLYRFEESSTFIEHEQTGSVLAIDGIIEQEVIFGTTDAVPTQQQYAALPDLSLYPLVASAVVLVYNIPELGPMDSLILDGSLMADIFLGKIATWNHNRILSLNPTLTGKLKNVSISVAHRSDGSGTTAIFTEALSGMSEEWSETVGASTTVVWPVGTNHSDQSADISDSTGRGLTGRGNAGVVSAVVSTPYSIGYVGLDYAMAAALPYAKYHNSRDELVLEANQTTLISTLEDFSDENVPMVTSLVNGPGTYSWPICGYVYIMLNNKTMNDCTTAEKLLRFAEWAVFSDEAATVTSKFGFASVLGETRKYVRNGLQLVTCNGSFLIGGCDPGFYYDNEALMCRGCPAGYYTGKGDIQCKPCPVGTASHPSAGSCFPCSVDTYSDTEGAADSCAQCPNNAGTFTTGSESLQDCQCEPSYYVLNATITDQGCQECPQGAHCDGNFTVPIPNPGYWSSADNPSAILECKPAKACVGGGFEACRKGHTGDVCAACEKGFYSVEGLCHTCPGMLGLRFLVIFIGIGIVFGVPFFLSSKNMNTVPVTINFMQLTTIYSTIQLNWSSSVGNFLNFLSPLNWILILSPPECAVEVDYFVKWCIRLFLPLIVLFGYFLILAVMFGIHSWFGKYHTELFPKNRFTVRIQEKIAKFTFARMTNRSINAFIVVMIGMYIFIAQAALEFFSCSQSTDGRYRLNVQGTVICYEGKWTQYLPLAVFALIAHVIAVPLGLGVLVYRIRKNLDNPKISARFGYVYLRYQPSKYWWEAIIFLRKLSIFLIILYFYDQPYTTGILVMAILVVSFFVHVTHKPFQFHSANLLEAALILCDYAILSVGVLFNRQIQSQEEIGDSTLNGLILFVGITCFVSAVLLNIIEIAYHLGATKLSPFFLNEFCGLGMLLNKIKTHREMKSMQLIEMNEHANEDQNTIEKKYATHAARTNIALRTSAVKVEIPFVEPY